MCNSTHTKKGLTLVETIVTILIVSIVMLGFTLLFSRLWRVYGFTLETGIATFVASRGVDDAVANIRSARQSENGSFALISADDNEFIFYADYDDDSHVERVRYFAEDQSLKVGIIEPNLEAFPVTYEAAESIEVVSEDVVNDVVINANVCNAYNISSGVDGSASSRFTTLGMARNVGTAGEYFFSLSGEEFQTQVTADGWVLMASGDGGVNVNQYTQVTSLDFQDDAILDDPIFAALGAVTDVRINATSGSSTPFDVRTTDADVIDRLKAFRTLGYNNATAATWVGDAAGRMDQSGNGPHDTEDGWNNACSEDYLDDHLYFACNNDDGMVWSHSYGPATNVNLRKEEVRRGNEPDNDLNLYARANPDSTVFNTVAVRQADNSFLDGNGASYTESALQSIGALCTEADVPLDRPVFEYYTDFTHVIGALGSGENFSYDDIASTALTTPVTDIASINLVKILLHVNPDPLQAPENIKIQSFVNLRNLSTYDTTSR